MPAEPEAAESSARREGFAYKYNDAIWRVEAILKGLDSVQGKDDLVFVTPSHARDLERVRRQRQCFRQTGTEIPHFIVVNTEDRQVFQTMLEDCGGDFRLLTTADVLPAWVEARRGKPYRRRDPRRWFLPQRISGWWAQQFVKLLAPEFTKAANFACLDSDACPIRTVVADDFIDFNRKIHLLATRGESTLTEATWTNRSYQALSLSTDVPVHRFVHNPVPMSSKVVVRMREELERRHGRNWIEVFLKLQLTEYATYGAYALHNATEDVSAQPTNPISRTIWFKEEAVDLERIVNEIQQANECKFLCVQSHLNISQDRLEPLYREVIGACSSVGAA